MNRRNKEETVIIGVDPGTCVTGYGVIKKESHHTSVIDYGCIRPPVKRAAAERYLVIFNAIDLLLERHSPDALAVETQFVYKNPQSALKLGMARGAVIIAAARRGVPVHEYAPSKAKLAVTGSGRASKQQVQAMVQWLLNLGAAPHPSDAADALALALCHSHNLGN